MNIPKTPAPTAPESQPKSAPDDRSSGFRAHLSRALAGAAHVAAGAASAQPMTKAVAAGLGGLSHLVGGTKPQAAGTNHQLEHVLSETQSINARYIELQSRMQMESQAFTAISNVLKARHESAQTALNNIR